MVGYLFRGSPTAVHVRTQPYPDLTRKAEEEWQNSVVGYWPRKEGRCVAITIEWPVLVEKCGQSTQRAMVSPRGEPKPSPLTMSTLQLHSDKSRIAPAEGTRCSRLREMPLRQARTWWNKCSPQHRHFFDDVECKRWA